MGKKEALEWNDVVFVKAGKHKGTIGIYDDDGDDGDDLIIYPKVLILEGYIVVPRRYCRKATAEEERTYRQEYDNDLVKARAVARIRKRAR